MLTISSPSVVRNRSVPFPFSSTQRDNTRSVQSQQDEGSNKHRRFFYWNGGLVFILSVLGLTLSIGVSITRGLKNDATANIPDHRDDHGRQVQQQQKDMPPSPYLRQQQQQSQSQQQSSKDLQTYEWISSLKHYQPRFLEEIPLPHVKPTNLVSIDQGHRDGLLHISSCIHVTDQSGNYTLLLKRASHLVTFPNCWMCLGEHMKGIESSQQMVQRAIMEELLGEEEEEEEGKPNSVATTTKTTKEEQFNALVQSITNLSEHPVYYYHHYGKALDNRIDRSLIYIYEVQLKAQHQDLQFTFDNEVGSYKWISLHEFDEWLTNDATPEVNYKDFCDKSISRLLQLGVQSMIHLRDQNQQKLE